jgi:hypothetical protein
MRTQVDDGSLSTTKDSTDRMPIDIQMLVAASDTATRDCEAIDREIEALLGEGRADTAHHRADQRRRFNELQAQKSGVAAKLVRSEPC